MKRMVAEGLDGADFRLKSGGREWAVHRTMLESRCEYFADMFRHDWARNTTAGEATFDDVEADALDSILDFVYTGDAGEMSAENVCEIYVAAHKFLLHDLKVSCVEYMKKNICVDIVCKVLVIADTYGEKDLNDKAMEYFATEAVKIMDSEGWKVMKRNHTLIAMETLEEYIKRLPKITRKKVSRPANFPDLTRECGHVFMFNGVPIPTRVYDPPTNPKKPRRVFF